MKPITPQIFYEYGSAKVLGSTRLGKLKFPNGVGGWGNDSYSISLNSLYTMLHLGKFNNTNIAMDDIIAIIAFGSAVKLPGTVEKIETRKKYFLFGEKVTKTAIHKIQPNDADFLIITRQNITSDRSFAPLIVHYYEGACLEEAGLHCVTRGQSQFFIGIEEKLDSVSISALNEGITVVAAEGFEALCKEHDVSVPMRRELLWSEDREGILTGRIV